MSKTSEGDECAEEVLEQHRESISNPIGLAIEFIHTSTHNNPYHLSRASEATAVELLSRSGASIFSGDGWAPQRITAARRSPKTTVTTPHLRESHIVARDQAGADDIWLAHPYMVI